jgi:hypothetical protein
MDDPTPDDLQRWEHQMEAHLTHCPICDDDQQRYCPDGEFLARLVMDLAVQQLDQQATGHRPSAQPADPPPAAAD